MIIDEFLSSLAAEGSATDSEEIVHWTAIILSFLLLAFLTLFVIIVLGRVLKKDFFQSTDIESDACKKQTKNKDIQVFLNYF